MKSIRIVALLLVVSAAAFAIEIPRSDSARLDITSRTSFGIDLDNPYRYGLLNELTQLDLVFGLAPYSPTSNRLNSPDAVGFINITLFNLDLAKVDKNIGFHPPTSDGGDAMGTNRYQTGEFLAGIAKGPWLVQLNAGGNEPFASPWNKGLQFINDGFKFSWAYLDSMVDIRRVKSITGVPTITKRGEENMYGAGDIGPEAGYTLNQFQLDGVGHIGDHFAPRATGNLIAVMYNADTFGVNVKLGTEFPFDSDQITEKNMNGIGGGVDSVFMPAVVPGLKIFASLMGTVNYGNDKSPDPLWGGTRVGYNIPLSEDISVEPWAGFDIGTKFKNDGDVEKPEYEASIGGTMRWPGFAGWSKDYIINSDGRVFPGMSVGYLIWQNLERETEIQHGVRFTLFEPKGDEGLFYKVGSEIIVDVEDLTWVSSKGFNILATAYVDFELGKIGKIPGSFVPWTILYFDNLAGSTKEADRTNNFKIDLGMNLENAIANTTFGIVWNSGGLVEETMDKHTAGYIRLFAEIRL